MKNSVRENLIYDIIVCALQKNCFLYCNYLFMSLASLPAWRIQFGSSSVSVDRLSVISAQVLPPIRTARLPIITTASLLGSDRQHCISNNWNKNVTAKT